MEVTGFIMADQQFHKLAPEGLGQGIHMEQELPLTFR